LAISANILTALYHTRTSELFIISKQHWRNFPPHKLLNVRMAIRTKGLGEKGTQNVFCSFSWNNSKQTMTALWEPRIYQLIASLGAVGKAVVEKQSLRALCEVAVNQALQLTNADRAYIKIFDDRIKALRFEAFVSNNENEKIKEKASDPSRGMTGHVFKTRRPYRSANVKQELPEMYHALFPNTLSALVVPLLESPGTDCYGTLSVNSNHADHFVQSDEDFLVVFASHIALAVRQLQRYEELITTHQNPVKGQVR
jgi:putative methionine-R-sulfoxide reductase with GAF domain